MKKVVFISTILCTFFYLMAHCSWALDITIRSLIIDEFPIVQLDILADDNTGVPIYGLIDTNFDIEETYTDSYGIRHRNTITTFDVASATSGARMADVVFVIDAVFRELKLLPKTWSDFDACHNQICTTGDTYLASFESTY